MTKTSLAMHFSPATPASAAELYFPDADANWETVEPASVGWDSELSSAASGVAGARKSSGVLILHDGCIMATRYWGEANSSLTAFRFGALFWHSF